jgi:putative ABC transport system permease protein
MLTNYIKIAIKILLRRKFFTFISLFAISFTLVVLMVATSILDHMFAPMLPETRLERTLAVIHMDMIGPNAQWNGNPGYKFLDKYVRGLANIERFSIYREQQAATSYRNGMEIKSMLKRTDGEYWKILDFDFIEGRPISEDDETNANFVAVINKATEEKFFGGGPSIGKTIEVDRQRFTVIGVVQNVSELRPVPSADIWVPNSTTPQITERDKLMGAYMGLLLARSADDFPAIKREFQSRLAGVAITDPEYTHMEGSPETYAESIAREILDTSSGTALLELIVALMFLFMLLPAINLVNINVSRILERSSEIGVRKTFGASPWTLVGQFIVENLVLTIVGGFVGFVFAAVILQIVNASDIFQYAHLGLNLRIFGYGFVLILVFGLLSGVYPAWAMSRIQPVSALKGEAR